MTKYTEEWIANGDTKFYTRIYSVPDPKAAVVFVHGFIEHIGRYVSLLLPAQGSALTTFYSYEHVIPRFAEAGISALGFDQRG